MSTSFTLQEILTYASAYSQYTLGENTGFPIDKTTDTISGLGSIVIPQDLASNVTKLHEFLFGTTGYTPSSTVQTVNANIISRVNSGGSSSSSDDYTYGDDSYYDDSEDYSYDSSDDYDSGYSGGGYDSDDTGGSSSGNDSTDSGTESGNEAAERAEVLIPEVLKAAETRVAEQIPVPVRDPAGIPAVIQAEAVQILGQAQRKEHNLTIFWTFYCKNGV